MNRPNVADPGRLIAHRGASRVAPENTLGAFRAAARQGVRWVEFDVSLLGDGTPVLHHDATLERCTDRTGPLSAIGRDQLAGILAGPDEPLPTLDQALDLFEELGFFANLELKPHDLPSGIQAKAVAEALAARPWTRQRIICSSFEEPELAALRQRMPEAPIAVLYEAPPADWPGRAERLAAAALHLHHGHLDQAVLALARSHGLDVRVYTVNDPDIVAPFRGHGLTGIITDHPPLFLAAPGWADWLAA